MSTSKSTSKSTSIDKPWLDASKPTEERIEALLRVMSLPEKIGQLHQPNNVSAADDAETLRAGGIGTSLSASGATAGNVRDEGVAVRAVNEVQRIAVEQSRLGIPVLIARDVIHGHRTMFPIPLGQAATWDEGLVEAGARVAAREAASVGIGWTFTPMMDITGDHRWGRVAESLGEDPVLAGRLAVAMVRGFQTDDLSAADAIAATAKHYVGYGLAEGGRDYNSVTAGENSLRNLQLRPFHEAVRAGIATVMTSFNDLDGVPVHGNRRYVREILKDEWQWDGAVVSDWAGIGELVDHRVAADLRDAGRQGLLAGVDMDMVSRAYTDHLAELVETGEIPVALVDDAVRRVLRLKFRCGLFERPYTDEALEHDTLGAPEHRAASRSTAAASMVLLKNDGVLPLGVSPLGQTLLSGPLAQAGEALMGTWTLDGRAEEVVTPLAALRALLPDQSNDSADPQLARVSYVPWGNSDEVLFRARVSDTVILLIGEHACRSGEANSVSTLDLPPGQVEILRAIRGLGKRLITVVFAGRALDLREVLANSDAVLWAWHPGSEAGNALADVLSGKSAPRGRLPMSLPRSVGQLPVVYNHRSTGRPIPPADDPQRGRYHDSLDAPLLPFGFGLTYGQVEYGPVDLSGEILSGGSVLRAAATVTNTGSRACTEVVQCYFRDDVAGITRPVRELFDWRLVELAPGESAEVSFELVAERLGYYGPDNQWRVEPGTFAVWISPNAAAGQPAAFRLQ